MWHMLSIGEVANKLRTDLNIGLSEKIYELKKQSNFTRTVEFYVNL